uniref:S1 motif domain-containing protein n=1 Tax=Heterorhabditis bacteriophora TaxID=37862 RepID=A0A1I7WS15_HETBA
MSSDEWVLDCSLHELIADEVSIDYSIAGRVVELFNDGNEVAYVARYRKDACGDMTCDQLRRAFKTFNEAKELNKKVGKAIANLTTKIKSENEQKQAIKGLKSARELADVCDITQLYASGRKTKADKARELGLEDVSRDILNGGIVEMSRLVNRSIGLKDIETVEENVVYIIAELLNKMSETIELVKKMLGITQNLKNVLVLNIYICSYILVLFRSHLDSNAVIFVSCELSSKAKKWTVIDKEYSLITHFKDYTKFNRNIQNVENYQVLAMDRGEDKGVLTWKIEVKDIGREHPGKRLRIGKPHINLVQKALKDSISRLFIPKIQRSVRRFLLARAEQAAITCFSRNIGQLFAQEGIQLYNIIALDPGFSACKAAFLAPNGSVLETAEFKLCGHLFDMKGSTILRRWADHSKPGLLIAIGNGKASLETQFAVSVMIKEGKFGKADVKFCVVPENGASKYSITPLAENELPHLPPTQRSAGKYFLKQLIALKFIF